ncbi:MAG TPA: hypothetical protein VNE61_08155 [Ktedonobacteraceae bacterium]|nr:hypothetical protein [Ktedonobacteraceae bacterium]
MKQLLTSKLFGVVVTGAMIGTIALSLLSGSLTCVYAAGLAQRPPQLMPPPKGNAHQTAAFL